MSEQDFGFLRTFLREQSSIQLEPGKEYLAECRLTPVARALGLKDIAELVALIRRGTSVDARRRSLEAMTTNETSFFRDVHPFETLRDHVLPEIVRARAGERALNIWCAASSSGQEPYTIAMVIREHFPQVAGWRVRIIGTDISTEMLRRTREGRYSQLEINRGLPARLLLKYFERQGLEWQIKKELRDMVDAQEVNLAKRWPSWPIFDVIFLRNVLIYFDVATKREILGRARKLMRLDGALFLGGAETPMGLDDSLKRTQAGPSWCYRLAAASPAPQPLPRTA
ncbi:MAG: protein-glutamate O-methyltransferase CheR [Planctomycetes bacterium]|nr:protein-glutamate O-methyltransferase CheR [Planctomycetota bacterium]